MKLHDIDVWIIVTYFMGVILAGHRVSRRGATASKPFGRRFSPVFNQIFSMMFLSGWLRRSNVLTGAEWIQTRFGRHRGANLAHSSVVVFALVNVVGMLAYAFKGIGKFAVVILPWHITRIAVL